MSSLKLLWAILGEDRSIENSQRGAIDNASLNDAMECLGEVLGQTGLIELVVVDPLETGPRGLQIRTEDGNSIITLAEVDDKKEKKIRTYRKGVSGGPVELFGGMWNSEMLCKDDDVIKSVVSELFTKMDVSKEILQ